MDTQQLRKLIERHRLDSIQAAISVVQFGRESPLSKHRLRLADESKRKLELALAELESK